jgi:hypothetical protein
MVQASRMMANYEEELRMQSPRHRHVVALLSALYYGGAV